MVFTSTGKIEIYNERIGNHVRIMISWSIYRDGPSLNGQDVQLSDATKSVMRALLTIRSREAFGKSVALFIRS